MSHNPYESHQSVDPADSKPEGFRWRLIPVAIMGGFGATFVLGGAGMIAIVGFGYMAQSPESRFWPRFPMDLFGGAIGYIFAGSWLILAARIGWKGRWKTAIAMSLGLYLLVATASLYIGS